MMSGWVLLLLAVCCSSVWSELCSEEFGCAVTEDNILQTINHVDTEDVCQAYCQAFQGCKFYTWHDSSTTLRGFCFVFSSCNNKDLCRGCHTGPNVCPTSQPPTEPGPQDCTSLIENPPENGRLDCYEDNTKCHLQCDPGYVTTGVSTVDCRQHRQLSLLNCEPGVVLVTGGDQALQRVEVYSSKDSSCRVDLPSLPSLYSFHSLDYLDGDVVLCGGSYGQICLTLLPNSTWTWHSNLTRARAHHSSGVHRNTLRLFGGGDSSMEYLSSRVHTWTLGSDLPESAPTDGCAAYLSPTEVLLTGGKKCPLCAHSYNWEDGTVTRLADMKEGRSSHGCATYQDPEDGEVRVIVAGGWSGHNMMTAEVYNPQKDRWYVVGDLTRPRRGVTLVTSEGGIVLAMGGRYHTAETTVDVYDSELELWTSSPPLSHGRTYHAVTAVPASKFCPHLNAIARP